MKNYGIQDTSVARKVLPLRKGFGSFQQTEISPKAEMRLKWMDYIDTGKTVAQASLHFDHPYSTIKFWRDRYNRYELRSLEDKSSRPKTVRSSQLTKDQKALILHARMYDLPGACKVTLQKFIQNEYGETFGQSAIQKVINDAKLVRVKKVDKRKKAYKKNKRHMYAVPEKVMKIPGGLVYLDVKHLKIGQKKYYQYTALDHVTRMMRAKIYRKITSESTVAFMHYIQMDYPFEKIQYLGTDNGSEFEGELNEYVKEKKIIHVYSSPSSPKQNPYVERVIRTIVEEVYIPYGLENTVELQQEALNEHMIRYNTKRPHQDPNLLTPVEMYVKLSATI